MPENRTSGVAKGIAQNDKIAFLYELEGDDGTLQAWASKALL